MSGLIYSTDQSTNIFLLKTEYTPKAVDRFVIIFNFQYYWMEKDELKITSPGITVRSYTSIWLHNSQLINFQYVSCLFYEYLQETVRHLHVLLDIFIIKMTSSLIIYYQ